MKLHSTKNTHDLISFHDAVFNSLPQDNGLFVPNIIPKLSQEFIANIHNMTLQQIALEVCSAFLGDEIPRHDLKNIVDNSINFDAPLVKLKEHLYTIELFHGPSLAFKDFGARFMAQIMSYYLTKTPNKKTTILVATSGDTGSAVAQAFLGIKNINVYILYPSDKITHIQEQQLTTLGKNITALEIEGTFDDCQRMVKEAFLDIELCKNLSLTSANSINIARLIPQTIYYFYAYAQLINKENVIFSVPSGNFGNLCAGILAKKIGLPIAKFIAATNINDIIPQYLNSGNFKPQPSKKTIANAMDVGNPSNFLRLSYFYDNDIEKIRQDIVGYSYTDMQIRSAIKFVYNEYNYTMDPHGAVAYLALSEYQQKHACSGVFLETAHPAKFFEEIEFVLGEKIILPNNLAKILNTTKNSIKIAPTFDAIRDFLMARIGVDRYI